jgi:LuxR family maltose regulon positive regulatory protein
LGIKPGKIFVSTMSRVGIPTSRTKIVIPALRPDILRRGRLLALFDDLLEKKLFIIVAPAGYGKTSLLVNFARQSAMPVCWLSLDALDQYPQRFFTYLIAALAERFPNFGKRSNAVLRTITSFEQDSERLLSSLINETHDLIKEHFTLILDDYHLVDSISPIRDMFSRFISLVGENCHVILAARHLPTLTELALMVARQQVSGFDFEDLAFRSNEIHSLFEQKYGVKLASQTVEELVRQTEGWITGLHLLGSEVTRGMADPSMNASRARQTQVAQLTGVGLSMYLDQQVLSQQPPELRQFLLKTSLLEEFDAGLCETVFGAGDWKNLLETVRRNNLFVLPVGPQGKWLRYHHLFGEFLQERIRQETPETADAIMKRLAEVCEERGEWEKTYALIRQQGDPEVLAGLIERIGASVLMNEHLVTLQSWLDDLPAALFEKRPALLSLKGSLLATMGDGRAALPLHDRAIVLFQNTSDQPGLPLALVRRAAARRIVGDYSGAVQDADEVLRLGENSPVLKTDIAEAARFRGISLFRLGQVEAAVASLEDSLQRYETLGEVVSIARLQMDLGWVCQATGKIAAATHYYQKALAEWKRENSLYSQAYALNNLAVLHYMQGDYESSVKTLEEGLVIARQGGFRWQEAMQLASLGDILSDLDEYESAHQIYVTATELAQQVSYQFLLNYLYLVQARLARLRGELREAHSHLQEVRSLIQATGSNYELGLLNFESGCLSLAEAKLPSALSELHTALDQFQQGNLQAEADWTRAWLAAAFARSGDKTAAREQLHIVLRTLSQNKGDVPLVHMLRHAVPLLASLQKDPESSRVFRHIARAEERLPVLRRKLRSMLLKAAPLQSSRLVIQALGKPQVRLNGKVVTLSEWQTLSVRDLFFYFLSADHPLSKEEIGEILWPDIDPERLKLRFKNNLYRLRHALGQDVINFENYHYSFNRTLDYQYDIEEFEMHLEQVRKAGKVEDKITHLLAVDKLWRGPYLQGVSADWAWPESQRLEFLYLEAMQQLAGLQRQAGDLTSALHICQRALEVNPCLEELHQLAMCLHADRGDQLAVIWQYQACRDALQSRLGETPSEETQILYQRLIA